MDKESKLKVYFSAEEPSPPSISAAILEEVTGAKILKRQVIVLISVSMLQIATVLAFILAFFGLSVFLWVLFAAYFTASAVLFVSAGIKRTASPAIGGDPGLRGKR